MEAIIVAVITAITSIIVAIIQARSVQEQTKILRDKPLPPTSAPISETEQVAPEASPQIKSKIVFVPPLSAEKFTGRFDRIWWLVGSIIAVEAIIFGIVDADLTPIVNSLVLIPLATCLLSFFRPVLWGYAAVFVAFLQGASFLGYIIGSGGLWGGDLQSMALIYIANAGICVFISVTRLRRKKTFVYFASRGVK